MWGADSHLWGKVQVEKMECSLESFKEIAIALTNKDICTINSEMGSLL